ncbi:sensor histidine kinase [Pseudoxanthomonas mexicana]|uniref:sensor histidine kinase n=1 Tax=Pseudoxanthomonas mexicana TaxID=128785 RepID=UPI0020A116ED
MGQKEIRDQLLDALRVDVIDYGKVLALAHTLSREDEDAVRFSVDASHISRLGLELVSKQETAISELIKNAYDADAVTVDVIFKNSSKKGGSLEVIDSGSGMTRDQLLDGFMRISTATKVSEPRSQVYGRQRAGRKGIGRFAAQRLGSRLHVSTQREGDPFSLEVNIDWDRFQSGVDLHQIANRIAVAEPKPSNGTTLLIEDLRDAWTEAQIKRAYRYVSDLLQPFPLDRKSSAITKPDGYRADPGFQATFYIEEPDQLRLIASDEQDIHDAAVATISARVDKDGQAWFDIESSKYPIQLRDRALVFEPKLRSRAGSAQNQYDQIGGVRLIARYFIQESLPSGSRGTVRSVLNRVGGVRLYRNGFRVLPYGESFDDWLGLQRSSALREVLPPHHNSNFIGFVEIQDIDGERFQETASREGLIENEAFVQLQDFAYRALIAGVIEVARERKKKLFARDERVAEGDDPISHRSGLKDRASEVASRLRAIADQAEAEVESGNGTDGASSFSAIADEIELLGVQTEEALEEVGMLRVLASLGLTIGEFTHEVRHALAALSLAIEGVASSSGDSITFTKLSDQVGLLRSYMRYFDDVVAQNANRALDAYELRDIFNEFIEVMRPTLARQNIEISLSFKGYDLFAKPMHKSEWASILLNLLTNSIKAISRARATGKIHVASSVVDDSLQIEFMDNGDGIPVDNWEKVFDAFFTTSTPSGPLAAQSEQLTGTGLGLKIVRDIVESIGGSIEVAQPHDGYSTCIRVLVPRAKEEQIGNDLY